MNDDFKHLEPFFGSWHMVELIGEGSFGKVYKIKRETFGQEQFSALKVLQIPQNQAEIDQIYSEGMDDASATTYFKSLVDDITREIDLMSKFVGNSNIVSYADHQIIKKKDVIGWTILIRMELLTSLKDFIAKNKPTQGEVVKLGIDICHALELCKKHSIIHRDIKAENIFVSDNGDYKLGDFGIARQLEKTMSGLSKKGTYTYMAPEVYLGKHYNASVDIYSLGIVMYRLLNDNRAPFMPAYPATITFSDRETAQNKQMAGEQMPPPKNADEKFAGIILKACAFNPMDRFVSPSQMREDLKALVISATKSTGQTGPDRKADTNGSGITAEIMNNENSESEPGLQALSDIKEDKTESIFTESASEKTGSLFDTQESLGISEEKTVSTFEGVAKGTAGFTNNWLPFATETGENNNISLPNGADYDKEVSADKRKKKLFLIGSVAAALVLLIVLAALAAKNNNDGNQFGNNLTTANLDAGGEGVLVDVPNVVGLTSDDALAVLAEKGLDCSITQQYSDEAAIGMVISQESAEGTQVLSGSTFNITVSKGKAFQAVPELKGLTVSDASNILQELGLVVSVVSKIDDSKIAGTISSQDPEAGETVSAGETVVLTIYISSKTVTVPSVTGKSKSEAESALKTAGLSYFSTQQFSNTVQSGFVISQGETAGTDLAKGSTVSIVVSKGKAPATVLPTTSVPSTMVSATTKPAVQLKQITVANIAASAANIDSIQPNTFQVEQALIDGITGNIVANSQKDVHKFTPSLSGRYRFEISGLIEGIGVKMYIYNQGGSVVESTNVIGNGGGISTDKLAAGQTYDIQVRQSSGMSAYKLNIGHQKKAVEISSFTQVSDSIQYTGQINRYKITPSLSGRYRFEVSGLIEGISVKMYIYNQGGSVVKSTNVIGNSGGISTDELAAGQTYEVLVSQYSGTSTYKLNIGYQKKTVDISSLTQVSDSIQYTGQINRYRIVPSLSGRYRFEVSGLIEGISVKMYIYNQGGGMVESTNVIGNNGGISTDELAAGQTYEVLVSQYSGTSAYKLNIGQQKKTVDISANSQASDSLQYTEQINRYKFMPLISGRFRFEISGLIEGKSVKIYIYNQGGGMVESTNVIGNNGGISTDKLVAGQTYEVQVRQSSGLSAYKLSVLEGS